MMKTIKLLLAFLMCSGFAVAQKVVYTSEKPNVKIALPNSGGDGRAVVLCPGGGYNHLSKDKESDDWIPYFTSQGIAVAVLNYDLPNGDKEIPLGELRGVFEMLRSHVQDWHINPHGIGIMGFSAGGHLASTFATHEQVDVRPAFQILLYPVIMLNTDPHQGMAKHFLGSNPTKQEEDEYSNNLKVDEDCAPTFLALASDDPIIDPQNSINYYNSLRKRNIPASLHIYTSGGHGFGFSSSFPYHNEMLSDLTAWLNNTKVEQNGAIRWACIGNSITFGAGLRFRNEDSYPAQIQKMLGDKYLVKNYGLSGRTMTTSGFGYMKEKAWKRVLDFKPNIVTIMLGTNDSQERYWHGEKAFEQDAQSMIDTLKSLPTKPRIILMLPTKSYPSRYAVRDSMVSGVIIPCLKRIAKINKLETINLYPVLEGHQELFHDKLHPNEEGAKKLADTITAYILSGKK